MSTAKHEWTPLGTHGRPHEKIDPDDPAQTELYDFEKQQDNPDDR